MTAHVVTANRLRDGRVVYLDRVGAWAERIEAAEVARDPDEAAALLARAQAADQGTRAVGPYLIDVLEDTGRLRAASLRERIRELGPTVATEPRPVESARPADAA